MKSGTPTKRTLLLLVLSASFVGCQGDGPGATPPPVEDKIAKIKNNPNIPERSKKIAIEMLEKQKAQTPKPNR